MADRPDVSDGLADLVAAAADEFRSRLARGERPEPGEYADRYPEAADLLRRVLGRFRPPVGAGDRLGDFRILMEVGRGGMGVVFEAEQVSLGRRVALKLLSAAAVGSPTAVQRFQNEARAAAGLDHPHMVKVYAVGYDAGVHYIAFQFIPGRSLEKLIAELGDTAPAAGGTVRTSPTAGGTTLSAGPTDPAHFRRAAGWVADAADALEHAHSLGVVHRDVKPGNLLVDAAGAVYVADFGLAQIATDPGLTATGDLLGTPRYMSPEQAEARHNLVDHRTDVYALGATLYELLTGRPAVPGASRAEVLRRIAADDPVPPRQVNPAVPTDLETVCLKCLEKDPGRRYQSARELAADLRRWLAHEPIRAKPPSAADRLAKWARRNRPVVAAGMAALVVVITALATSTALIAQAYSSEAAHRKDAEDQTRKAEEAKRVADAQADSLRAVLYPADIRRAWEAWPTGDWDRLRETLDSLRPGPGEADRRGFEWHYLDACSRATAGPVLGRHGHPLGSADISADGQVVASADKGGVIKLWNPATVQELRTLGSPGQEVTCVRFAPDGRTLAAAGVDRAVRLFDVATGRQTACLTGHERTVTSVSWSPDGKRLVSGGRDHAVRIWDTATKESRVLSGHADVVRCVAWSPKGGLVASAGREGAIRLWNPDTYEPAGVLEGHDDGVPVCLAFDAWGEYLASGGYGDQVLVHYLPTRQVRGQFVSPGNVWAVTFNRRDDRQLIIGREGRIEVWDRSGAFFVPLHVLSHPGPPRALAFTGNCRTLLTASETESTVRLTPFPEASGYKWMRFVQPCVAFDPGRQLAYLEQTDLSLVVKRYSNGSTARKIKFPTRTAREYALSPTGDALLTVDAEGVAEWHTADGHQTTQFPAPLAHLAVSPDGSLAAGVSKEGTFSVWRPATGEAVTTLPLRATARDGLPHLTFSPDGATLATTNGPDIVLWQVGTWVQRGVLAGTQETRGLAFSPNSQILAAAGGEDGVTLWAADTGRRLGVLTERAGAVVGVAFAPDGRTLATVGTDQTVRLWHVPTRRALFTLYRHFTPLNWVAFASPTRLMVGGDGRRPGQSEVYVFPPLNP